ncbi:MAG: hypothetical protein K8S23_06945, partial [Candidatus Cloacimonetes bacterium]|nr:hypothetical protein [Candidatus Cloacimonadota bacterium]
LLRKELYYSNPKIRYKQYFSLQNYSLKIYLKNLISWFFTVEGSKMLNLYRRMNNNAVTFSAILTIYIFMFFLSGCQDMFNNMGEILALQKKLSKEFKTANFSINLSNGGYLTISIVNSPIAELEKIKQKSYAHEIAIFVRDNYAGYEKLSIVSVAFIQHKQFGPVSSKKTKSVFTFMKSELNPNEPEIIYRKKL